MSVHRSGTRGVARHTRESQILDAAIVEFGIGGWHATSVSAVATRAGVSKALVLAYFGNKDALYARSVAAVAEPMLERVRYAVENSEPGVPMALRTVEAIAVSVDGRPRDWLLVDTRVDLGDDDAAEDLAATQLRFRELSLRGIRALFEARGSEVEALDEDMFCRLWESLVSSVLSWWIDHPSEPIDVMLSRCERIIGSLSLG